MTEKEPSLIAFYRRVTWFLYPFIVLFLKYRQVKGKEDRIRFSERLGYATIPRPSGSVMWFHAASVGEALSLLVLIKEFCHTFQNVTVLVTTGTVTSARLMAQRLPRSVIHQYIPVDAIGPVTRFLSHWKPNAVGWVESEIWPNLLSQVHQRQIPAVLINGSISDRTAVRWGKVPATIRYLMGAFKACLVQSDAMAARFALLGATSITIMGNLKCAADPLPVNETEYERLAPLFRERYVWLLASSHPGDEDLAADVHRTLHDRFKNLLTVIIPRHPERGGDIEKTLRAKGFVTALRSRGESPEQAAEIYVADTMGETGLFYRLCPLVCMGKSFHAPGGGQNPLEPVQLGCVVFFGPLMNVFSDIAKDMLSVGAAIQVKDSSDLSSALRRFLENPEKREETVRSADAFLHRHRGMVNTILDALRRFLPS